MAKQYTIIGVDRVLARYRIMPNGLSSDPNLVLEHRLRVIERHLGVKQSDIAVLSHIERNVIARCYLAAAIEYLQLHNQDRALMNLYKAFSVSPPLASNPNVLYELALGDQPKGFRGCFSTMEVERNGRLLLDLLEHIFCWAELPIELSNKRRQAFAQAYYSIGQLYYGQRNLLACRRALCNASHHEPKLGLDPRFLILMMKSLLPPALLERAKQLRFTAST